MGVVKIRRQQTYKCPYCHKKRPRADFVAAVLDSGEQAMVCYLCWRVPGLRE